MLSVQSNPDVKWQDKINKAFWRGRDSRRERLNLVELSRKHPDFINASLTNFFFFRNEEHKYGPKEDHISFFKFFDVGDSKVSNFISYSFYFVLFFSTSTN